MKSSLHYYRQTGLLFSPDLLQQVAARQQRWCRDSDFPVDKGLRPAEEAQRAFSIVRAAWHEFSQGEAANSLPFVSRVLTKALGYATPWVCPPSGITAEAPDQVVVALAGGMRLAEEPADADSQAPRLFPITWLLRCPEHPQCVPVLAMPANVDLDKRMTFATGQAMTPTQMMQTFLNAAPACQWGIVSNGSTWRLVRDSLALSRLDFLEIDLGRLMEDKASQAFDSEFWRVLHSSRPFGPDASCLWEDWRRDLEEHGARAREGLREGVAAAVAALGTGFLKGRGPGNEALRHDLAQGEWTNQDFYQELLRLVYRLIFIAVLEERDLLHAHATANQASVELYRKGYSIARLAPYALAGERDPRNDDLWQGQLVVFRALGQDGGQPQLALPGLGGLFDNGQCPRLDKCRLPNAAFLQALRHLCWTTSQNQLTQVNYGNIGAEELGSVYESLLELTPRVSLTRLELELEGGSGNQQKGNARKTSGSYYTPTCLIDQALKSSLEPLLDACSPNPIKAQSQLVALRVIDPACGSGHFLLAAARRIAERLANARTPGQNGYSPEVYRRALHDVIRCCIYGVDSNPMAVELARMSLWLEGYMPGKALSFLDSHLRCGNSLLGVFSRDALKLPLPDAAFKPLEGDDKALCAELKKSNRDAQKSRDTPLLFGWQERREANQPDALPPEDEPSQVRAQQTSWERQRQQQTPAATLADLWVGAFLLPKNDRSLVYTTSLLDDFQNGQIPDDDPRVLAARETCRNARVFHWFLEFPEAMADGGFHCVLGNPPWERPKIQEKEWFASRFEPIADAPNAAARKKLIQALAAGQLDELPAEAQQRLYAQFMQDLRTAAAISAMVHMPQESGGRFPLSGVGDVNMYALFAELNNQLRRPDGRAGFIVPTGIATDASTSRFFGALVAQQSIATIYDFENREGLFPEVDSRQRFCCFVLAQSETIRLACYMTHPRQLADKRRLAELRVEDLALINPNTRTIPLLRCRDDAELAVKIYRRVPILIDRQHNNNPWNIRFGTMFHMSNDSGLFLTERPEGVDVLPLYEGKMIHQYDHRFNTFTATGGKAEAQETSLEEHQNPQYEPSPRYWVRRTDAIDHLPQGMTTPSKWLIGFRGITNATNERTLIMALLPFAGVGHSMPLLFSDASPKLQCCFVANASSLVLDYIVRVKVGGINMTYNYLEQFPMLPPEAYSEDDIAFISSRVLELSYTTHRMKPLAEALGYDGPPFPWDDDRRAQVRAELDAYYARLYGLTSNELAYILAPETRYPEACPTVTFPGLRNNEIKRYGEYRTQRLVLAAWDAQAPPHP